MERRSRVPRGVAVLVRAMLGTAGLGLVLAVGAGLTLGSSAGAAPDRSPYGRLDSPRVIGPGAVWISGWAIDPDTRGPIKVIVSANGRLAGGSASLIRTDLARSNNRHGYSFVIRGLAPGPTQVCAGAFNVGPGDAGRLVGCALVNTGGANPIGNIDEVEPTGASTARVAGWALDPDTPFPTPVDVIVDGTVVTRTVAARSRPDVGRAYPGWTDWHGFETSVALTEGSHRICIRPLNLGPGRTVELACRVYTTPAVHPFGAIDAATLDDGAVTVTGWAVEPDQASPPNVVVSFDDPGPGDPVLVDAVPDQDRPDVSAAVGRAGRWGLRVRWTPTRSGTHTVCLAAANRGWGSDRLLGCRSVVVIDGRPIGELDSLVPGASSVQVVGWTVDPSGGTGLGIRVSSDRTSTTATGTASLPRPDVVRPDGVVGGNIGYSVTLGGLSPGAHRICVEVTDGSGPADALVGSRRWCGSALVGPTRLALLESESEETAVGPAPGTPLADVERDGGVSTRLSDGSVLWLFGDSSARHADGSLRYFVSGTAAWAAAGAPAVTRDGVVNGRPVAAAVPTSGFPPCPPQRPTAAMWPMAAVTIADGATDRVIAWFANMCLNDAPSFEAMGTAVAEWRYDPSDPPVERPIQFTVTNQVLWPDVGPGEAAVVDPSGRIVTYHCDGPDAGGWFSAYGPCVAARVEADDVADPAGYQFWDGSGWTATRSTAAPLTLPMSGDLGVGTYPPAAFTVTFDDILGRYVMTYTSWPGYTGTTWVRVASSPSGPWSEAMRVDIADCSVTIGGRTLACYAATAQPVASSPGRFGLGIFRSWLLDDPERAGYRLVHLRLSTPP